MNNLSGELFLNCNTGCYKHLMYADDLIIFSTTKDYSYINVGSKANHILVNLIP